MERVEISLSNEEELEEELEDHAEELGLLQSMPHAKALSAAYLDHEEYWVELYDEKREAELPFLDAKASFT